jgi:acyl-CoA synthetase (AMP-forming)/AMP-acid ligase II
LNDSTPAPLTGSPIDASTLWELIEARAQLTPDDIAIVDERDRVVTFGEFRDGAVHAAAGFHELGVSSGDIVAWQLPTWIETITLMAALARLGARQVPILPIHREHEVAFCVAQSNAGTLCVPSVWRGVDYRNLAERVRDERGDLELVICDRSLPDGDPQHLPPPPDDDGSTRWIFYTSGTTADPKGARHTDRSIMASAAGFCEAVGVRPDDRYGVAFPFTHIGGPNNLCAALQVGFALVVMEAFDVTRAVDLFRRHRVTMVGGGPVFYRAFLEEQRRESALPILPTLRFMTGGGAPMPPELHFEVRREIGGAGCAHGYGMTEACIVAMNHPDDDDDHLAHTVGRPTAGVEVRVVTTGGAVAGAGVGGEVQVRGPAVFAGYVDEALDAVAFDAGGWFRTGDLGYVRADGALVITGRLKDIIIRKGENISAQEIEDLLYEHPKVADVVVIGLPDPERGERVCAVVRCADPGHPLTMDELVAHLNAARIMRQKVPEQLELVETLPRNAAGKVLKSELQARFGI